MRSRTLLHALLIVLVGSAAQAHLIVDVRMGFAAPQFVPVQQAFTFQVIADDLANDSGLGVVVTTVLPSNVTFSKASGDGWRCSASKLTVTCSADQIAPGPNAIAFTVTAPAAPGHANVTTSVTTIGSTDLNPANDNASLDVVAYDPSACRADAPLLDSPEDHTPQPAVVVLSWSAVDGASDYTVFTAVEGATPGALTTTSGTKARIAAEPGDTEWWIVGGSGNCPPVESLHRHFTASATLPVNVETFAGQADVDRTSDGARAVAAFRKPYGLALSPQGDLYVSDEADDVVRRVSADVVTTIAGVAGAAGAVDGQFATFRTPRGLTVTPLDGFIYAADSENQEIRILYIGGPFVPAYGVAGGAQLSGYADGAGDHARFDAPSGIAATERGTLYVADTQNHVIRRLTPVPGTTGAFTVTTVAGAAGVRGSADGASASARFAAPAAIAVDANEVLYVADTENHTIRRIANGSVTTIAGEAGVPGSNDGRGSAAHFNNPSGIAVDGRGNLYVSDTGNDAVRRVTPSGLVTTMAGAAGSPGNADGLGTDARLSSPTGIVIDAAGTIFVADSGNHVLRAIRPLAVLPSGNGRRRSAPH